MTVFYSPNHLSQMDRSASWLVIHSQLPAVYSFPLFLVNAYLINNKIAVLADSSDEVRNFIYNLRS